MWIETVGEEKLKDELGKASARAACLVTFATQHRPTDLRLKRNLIVLAAVVANDLESLSSVITVSGFFRTTFCAPLRRHHVPLVKDLLLLFGEKKRLFTLNACSLDVRHRVLS